MFDFWNKQPKANKIRFFNRMPDFFWPTNCFCQVSKNYDHHYKILVISGDFHPTERCKLISLAQSNMEIKNVPVYNSIEFRRWLKTTATSIL